MFLETERLHIQKLTVEDAPFFYELVNDPDWKRYIGDRNVHNITAAERYITDRIVPSYDRFGFGFYLVIEKSTQNSIGISGFIKREELDFANVGFAFLPLGRGKGYAYEATKALMEYGTRELGFTTVLAIANNDNKQSHHLLEKLGLQFDRHIQLGEESEEISLFST